jgi:hypothetical protein
MAVRNSKVPDVKKRGIAVRLYLMLLDQKEHIFDEFYDWAIESIEPQMATRAYQRTHKKFDVNSVSLEEQLDEGRRIIAVCTLHHMIKRKTLKVTFPEKEAPRHEKSRGYWDLRKCTLQLTKEGLQQVLFGYGIFTKMMAELHTAYQRGRVGFNITYLGKPNMVEPTVLEVEESDNECVEDILYDDNIESENHKEVVKQVENGDFEVNW